MRKASNNWTWLFAATLILLCVGAGSGFLHRMGGEGAWPLENGARWLWRGAAARVVALWKAQEAVSRLHALEAEVERLRLDARILEEIAAENRELRSSIGLPPAVLRRPLRCEAVSWGGALGWWQSVKISRGARDGVREGDAVVTAEGLVGRVKRVYSDVADVALVTDPNSRIACALELPEGSPSVRGVLHGAGWEAAQETPSGGRDIPFLFVAQPLRLEYLDRDALDSGRLASRTRVVTSGQSDSIPGGIPVGWLVSASLDGDGLYGVGRVLPAVDFAAVRTMFVLAESVAPRRQNAGNPGQEAAP